MRRIAIIISIGLLLLVGCSSSDETEDKLSAELAALQDSLELVELDEDLIRTASARLIAEFSSELQARLAAAIKASGPTGAISECRLIAPAIADSMGREGWSIRRISDKNRNPDNRATLAEKSIMAVFTDAVQPKRKFFGDWKTEDSVTTYTYYKPIYIKKNCLQCHGDLQTLAPNVYKMVKKHYPIDKAKGYREGDLRGMFVVETVWPDGKNFAVKLLAGHAFDAPVVDSAADTTVVDSNTVADSVDAAIVESVSVTLAVE